VAIDIERIKNSVDIVDVIGGYVDLKKQGGNYFGCCPFHTENSSSFSVSQNKQFYHCFGCSANGDVVGFLQEYLNIEFIEAVKIIDNKAFDNALPSTYVKKVRINLPLNQVKKESANDVLSGCSELNGHYFTGDCQVVPLINVQGELLSLAMIKGQGFDIRFLDKQFVYGSCHIFGALNGVALLVTDYWQALRVNREYGVCTICVFDPLNIHFIVSDLRRLDVSIKLLCNQEEDFIQAEKLHIYEVFNKQFGVKCNVEQYLDKRES
jgi:hypothetical protein